MILALFKAGKINKKFYDGRKPNYEDVQLIADRIDCLRKNEKEIDEKIMKELKEIARFVLQKAITFNDYISIEEQASEN